MDCGGSHLIAKLESSDLSRIHELFSDYLHPLKKSADRSLVKKFLPFLNRALSILPKRLSETPKLDEQFGGQLFDTYKLCLNCLERISSQLSCKPYSVHIQRARLIHCFEAWGRYSDAESEGFSVLESLRTIEIGGWGPKAVKKTCQYVPDLGEENVDHEFSFLVVETVVTLVKCLSNSQSKEEGDYWRLLNLVGEVTPWFGVLDTRANEKLHKVFVTYLNKCTLFLVGELMLFNKDLVRELCLATFAEYSKLSMENQLLKFACRVCSSLFSQQDDQSSPVMDILKSILDAMASECKMRMKENGNISCASQLEMESTAWEFLQLVCYCANKCRGATKNFCCDLGSYLSKIPGQFCQGLSLFDLILRLYCIGLFLTDCISQSRQDNDITIRNTNVGSLIAVMLNEEGLLHEINEASKICERKREKLYLLSYFNALKFLCQPLAEFVNSATKEIVAEIEGVSFHTKLCSVQDAFHQFCIVFPFCQSELEKESNAFDDCDRTVLSVAVAALTLSFTNKLYLKESISFIEQVISLDWIQANGLKFLYASLYNVGITVYRNMQLKEASEALKLCCRASWTCVSYLCEAFVNKSNGFCGEVTEEAVACFVDKACSKTAFLLDLLFQCENHNEMTNITRYSLENWSAAQNVFNRLPCPIALVKQWVKIECRVCKDPDMKCSASTLYSLLSSSAKVSKRSLGIILEQELLAYNEMRAVNPTLCQKMQLDIIADLLAEVYVTDDSCLQKSKVLIAKGRELRASGIEGLNGCIQCLSEAISIMEGMNGEAERQTITVCHQLAVAYSLRALCISEAAPNSEQPFEDIRAAINLWMTLVGDQCGMVYENMLAVLYHVVDLLSIKGHTEFHPVTYELLIRLFKRKNIPLEKCLALLWQQRRLGHALCAAPVNDAFITTLSQHCGKNSESIDFWTCCMNGSLKMGFQQSFASMISNFSCGSCHTEGPVGFNIKVDHVKQAASDLIASVPLCSGSVFLAAHLYYDLCVRMISNGKLIEAISYAKEALRLRSKLLQEKFRYSIEKQTDIYDEDGEIIQRPCYHLSTFQIYGSAATAVWSSENILHDLEACILTPWNILQCYLESTLQVGVIHELVGNGSEAETLLLWGKNISSLQGLPVFIVAFSSVLGRLYRKERLWDLAEKELQSAKKILADLAGKELQGVKKIIGDCCNAISCLKCRLLWEVTIDLQQGDLLRSRDDIRRLCEAENLYGSALKKLNLSEWKISVNDQKEIGAANTIVHDALVQEDFPAKVDEPVKVMEAKRCRKTKKGSKSLLQEQYLMRQDNIRMTRSRYRSQRNNESVSCEVQVGLAEHTNNEEKFTFLESLERRGPDLKIKSSVRDSGCEITFLQQMKWEFARRKLSLRLLAGIGKCLEVPGEIHRAHEVILQSISVLVRGNPISESSTIPLTHLLDLVEKYIPGDSFAVERAAIIYNICWLTLKSYSRNCTRINCCELTQIPITRIIHWLMLAFVLCHEVPKLLQKVSTLLAAIFVLSASTELFSSSLSPFKALSESHCASYFHQASIGTLLNHKLFSCMNGKQKARDPMDVEGSCFTSSSSVGSEMPSSLRLPPESDQDLEGYILEFFQCIPPTTIICLSLLGGAFASLLTELLNYPCTHSWILLSRLNSNSQPAVILLPVDSILEEALDNSTNSVSGIPFEERDLIKRWRCPWGSTVIDEVAPMFRLILEENYFSSSVHPLEDTKKNRSLWWMQRKNLDQRLGKFLRVLEDSWFGPWKYLLLGERPACMHLELVEKNLALNLNKGCFIGVRNYNRERGTFTDTCDGVGSLNKRALELEREAAHEVEEEECGNREPVILVLDFDVQMLPWESLPVLRNQEVYRMPSIGSIFATLNRCDQRQKQVVRNPVIYPLIDPLDAFYLLNPSGDLSSTQFEFENWFRDQNLEGKAGATPTIEELAIALRSHDLFLYFGHGSGTQYIPGHEIQKLENCAATLLMGCSSGSLSLKGGYTPQGAPLSYLLAGSPVIVANLWEVTDKDIDRFGRAMLDCLLRERSAASNGCSQCNFVTEKLKSMQITGTKGNNKKKISRKKLSEDIDANRHNDCCNHRPRIGSFMGQARETCTLPFLIGAAPVCYGVPTGIRKKKDL